MLFAWGDPFLAALWVGAACACVLMLAGTAFLVAVCVTWGREFVREQW